MLKKRLIKGSFAEFANFALILVKGIVIIPIILTYWTSEKYGVLITTMASIEFFKILDVGYQNFVRNEINSKYHTNNEEARFILGSGLRFTMILGFVEFLLGSIFFYLIKNSIILSQLGKIFSNEIINSTLTYLFFWTFLGSISGILGHLLQTIGHYVIEVRYMIIQIIAQIAILIFSAFNNYSISITLYLLSFCFFILTVYFLYDIKQKAPYFFPWWKSGNFTFGFNMFKKSIVITYANTLELITTNGMPIIITSIVGPSALVTFNAIRVLSNSVSQISNLIINPALPEILRLHSLRDFSNIQKIIKINWVLIVSFLSFGIIFSFPFVGYLFKVWTRGKLEFSSLLYILLILSTLINVFNKPFSSYLTITNDLSYISISATFKILVLSIILYITLINFGIQYTGFAFLLSEILILIYTVYVIRKESELESEFYSIKNIIRYLSPLIICAIFLFISIYLNFSSLILCIISLIIILIMVYRNWIKLFISINFLKFKLNI